MTPRYATLSAVLLSTLLLAACGQKGPLYLPEDADSGEPRNEQPAPEGSQSE